MNNSPLKFKIDFQLDTENYEKYNKNKFDKSIIYECLICHKKSNIFNMVSNKGARMICTHCAKKHFGDNLTAIRKFCKLRGD